MRRSRGFTLAELAVAMVIVALLLAGSFIPLSTQIEVRNVADTRRTVDQIKEALIGFAQANGRLPCPADGTVGNGSNDAYGQAAGTEQYTPVAGPTQCAGTAGVVPWKTLGTPELDAWGRRFSYRVSQAFADNWSMSTWGCTPTITPTQPTSFALCAVGGLTVNTRNDTSHAGTAIASQLPAVVISHGRNGYGARTSAGVLITWASGDADGVPDQNADEAANVNPAATTFYIRNPTSARSGCSDATSGSVFCEFDDMVSWISPNTLIARMVSAGKLP
jgi:prepilin-type N-terminal cleavage/methylation domain-containing protein